MKAKVDENACIGCGICEQICPSVFKMTDEGLAKAIEEDLQEDKDIECANEAKEECPVDAISVE